MMKPGDGLSRANFEQVLARALELEELSKSRLTDVRAGEIAREVGVSTESWQRALAEHQGRAIRAASAPPTSIWTKARPWLVAGVSLSTSLSMGVVERGTRAGATSLLSHWVFELCTLFAVPVILFLYHLNRRTPVRFQLDLAAWFPVYPIGFALGFGRVWDDVVGFCLLAWAGSAAVGAAAMWMRAALDREALHRVQMEIGS